MSPEERAAYRKKWARDHRERRAEFKAVVDALKNVPCTDCGVSYPSRVMEFDHLDPKDKKINISRAVGKTTTWASQRAVLEEIKKCQVVCANCHRLREIKRDEL
jgi:hypothetical protein